MKHTMAAALSVLFVFTASAATATNPTPEEILRISDAKIAPKICSYTLTIETTNENGKRTIDKMIGYKKGSDKNVTVSIEPKRIAGSASLKKGNVIWSYFTTNYKLTKFAYQSLFMGTLLSYGDVLATELSYDYDIVSMKTEGGMYVFQLTAKKGHDGYAKVILDIDRATLLPKRREYYAVSGILLKTSEFTAIAHDAHGHLTSMEQVFYEPLKNRRSIVRYENLRILKDIPEKYYNENYLKFLGGE